MTAMLDDKYGQMFADALADANLPVMVTSASTAHLSWGARLNAYVEVADLGDWELRHAVLRQAAVLEDGWGIAVYPFFRQQVAS